MAEGYRKLIIIFSVYYFTISFNILWLPNVFSIDEIFQFRWSFAAGKELSLTSN